MIGNIGTLAVIAILVGVTAPSVIKRVDRAAWTRETTDLQTIADSYTQYILRNHRLPAAASLDWATNIANYMSLPVSSITTNSRRFARAFLVDTNLSINGAGLPYTQTTNGTPTKPVSARVIIVSSLARALPTNIVSGAALSTTEFNAIWDAPEGAKPSTSTWTSWAGSADDLRIKRLNLEPLFYQLILVDRDTANPAFFSIDSTLMPVPTTNSPPGWNRYYLDGTIVGLHTTNGVVQSRYSLKRSISFVFQSGSWPQETPSRPAFSGTGSDFVNHALGFFSSRTNPYPQSVGASQESVMMAMYAFMFDYTLWANECPHFSDHGNPGAPTSVPEYMLLRSQGQNNGNVDTFSAHLIATPTKGTGSSP
jgi:hypothetical protein